MIARSLLVSFLSLALFAGVLARAEPRTVRDFGAVGDGRHDDTAAIQKAVDAGGAVRFPAGTFRLTKPVEVQLQKTGLISLIGEGATVLEMAGEGPAFHFVGTLRKNIAPAELPDDFWTKAGNLLVTGIGFVGSNPASVGLEITHTVQMTIANCSFRQLRYGIHYTEVNRNAIVTGCHVYNNREAGIYFDHVDFHQVNIVGSHISYNRGGGIVARGGALRNLQIGTCDIEANVGPGLPPTANVFIDSTGGSVGEVEITGCTIQHFPNTPGFANIHFIGLSTAVNFTKERRHGNLIVTGNMINDADVNIHLESVRGAVISGNTISLASSHDILIENSAEIMLTDIALDRHPRYRPDRTTWGGPVKQGIVIRNSGDCTLSSLRINGGKAPAAIEISGGSGFHINNCTVAGADGIGLLLTDVRDSMITANMLSSSAQPALAVRGGAGNQIDGNLIRGRSEIDPASRIAAGK